jgi:dihydropteroate synthase
MSPHESSSPPGSSRWHVGAGRVLAFDQPRVMAILNITPDSFSDGGQYADADAVVTAAAEAVAAGAAMLDIGGESTRPGAARVAAEEQIARVVPAIHAIRAAGGTLRDVPISIDTTRASVAAAALDAGADAINDVSAGLEDAEMLALAAKRGAGVILMHRRLPPQRDSYSDRYARPPAYADVVAEVRDFLAARRDSALHAGVAAEAIVLDPGLGFGKSVEQNFELVRRTAELVSLGHPVLSAASRKSFVGRAMGLAESDPSERLAGSIAFSIAHYLTGARLFRVHDVAAQAQALRAVGAISIAPA